MRDYGDVTYDEENIRDVSNMSHLSHVASCTSRLSDHVRQVIQDDRQVVTIGGDHSVVIGTIDGHIKVKKYFFLWGKSRRTVIQHTKTLKLVGKTRCGSAMGRRACGSQYQQDQL